MRLESCGVVVVRTAVEAVPCKWMVEWMGLSEVCTGASSKFKCERL